MPLVFPVHPLGVVWRRRLLGAQNPVTLSACKVATENESCSEKCTELFGFFLEDPAENGLRALKIGEPGLRAEVYDDWLRGSASSCSTFGNPRYASSPFPAELPAVGFGIR